MNHRKSLRTLMVVVAFIGALRASGAGEVVMRDVARYGRRQRRQKWLKKLFCLSR